MKSKFLFSALTLCAISIPVSASASCDLCAVYVAQQVNTFHPGELSLGIAEQFTSSGRLQTNGDKIDDPANQFMNSSTTQIFSRFDLSETVAIQANIPFINRDFRRAVEGGTESGSVSGLGDISLLGLYAPVHLEDSGNLLRVTLTGGVKIPTGSFSRLREELGEGHSHGGEHSEEHEEEMDHHSEHSDSSGHSDDMHSSMDSDHEMQTKTSFRHGGMEHGAMSGVHGHGLALGTGSWDVIAGSNIFGRYGRWLTAGSVQYTFRNTGSYGYRYGNDFLWDLGVGRYLILDEGNSLALRFNMLGEVKDYDTLSGVERTDSGLTSLFMGPEINFTAGNNVFGLLALDIPTIMNNTETGVVADYRVRLSVMYRF
jgi:hypothetical protein